MTVRVHFQAHRRALRAAHLARLAWWWVRRPEVHGCNVVVRNPRGEVLLVRHSYQSPGLWMLPGGGVRPGESASNAAVREVFEETGCRIAEACEIGVETVRTSGARNHIHVVGATTCDAPSPDGREIVAAQFFAVGALPAATGGPARRRIERCLAVAQNSES